MPGWLPQAFAHALACVALLLPAPAHARHILDLDVAVQPARLQDWGDYAIDDSGGAVTLHAMLAQPERFKPTLADSRYGLGPGQVLWIRFTVPAAPDDQRWYVRLAEPGLDSVTLFTRGGDDRWNAQRAGDSYPVSLWALPHMYPVLPLAVSAADPSHYMLRIEASDGLAVPVEFVSESWLSWEQQRLSLLHGVYFGLLAMAAIFALASSAVLRDWTYFWFGTWTVLAMLATASAAGVAGLHLWPEAPGFSDAAHHVLPPAATSPFLLFLVQAMAVRERAERMFWPCVMLGVAALGFAVLCAIAPSPARRWLAEGTVALMAATAVGIAVWSWRRGEPLARHLLWALLPFGVTLALYAARSLDGLWLTEHALAILMTGLAVTIAATYLLLASRAQTRRDSHRRIAQLQEIDPATGLVNDSVFGKRLVELIARAQRFEHQSAVAIVEFPNFAPLRAEFGRKHSLELLLRLAVRLNAMMRTVDTVARLGDAKFGLLVDGPVAPSRARAMCAKVIAHCITPMAGLPMGMVPKPRIALALVPGQGADAGSVIARLEQMMREAADDPARVILIAQASVVQTVAGPPKDAAPATMPGNALSGNTDFQPTSASDEVD
jgi:GGDEF domain-containing protein